MTYKHVNGFCNGDYLLQVTNRGVRPMEYLTDHELCELPLNSKKQLAV